MEVIDPTAIHEAKKFVQQTLAVALKESFLAVYRANADNGPYRPDQVSVGKRSLKNTCLAYLSELEDADVRELCVKQFRSGGNMTDVMSALVSLANAECREREDALASFYKQWKDDPLVMDKWLAIQATSRLENTLDTVKKLTSHPAFNIKNPNKVRSLIGAFASNAVRFHDPRGAGYAFLADHVLAIDAFNPQIAARLVSVFHDVEAVRREAEKAHEGAARSHDEGAEALEGRLRGRVEKPGVSSRAKNRHSPLLVKDYDAGQTAGLPRPVGGIVVEPPPASRPVGTKIDATSRLHPAFTSADARSARWNCSLAHA